MHVLALNSGSSSLKFGLHEVVDGHATTLLEGEAEDIGGDRPAFGARDGQGRRLDVEAASDGPAALDRIVGLLDRQRLPAPDAVGHRIVHGGPDVGTHRVIDGPVMAALEAACRFAPLHLPPALDGIRFAIARFPGVRQVACLDTAFHARLEAVARTFPLPLAFRDEGIVRYGFHGLSYESIVRQCGGELPRRMVVAHLGSGASLAAIRDGRSIDTTMGLTPTGGLVMATRSGDLDPGVLIYLSRERGLDADALEHLLDREAGLKGISGLSGDLRRLREAAPTNADARLAIAIFCHAVRKQVAAMAAALEGIDALVFTGGIGEHDAATRQEVCAGLGWLGVVLDAARNRAGRSVVSADGAAVTVRVLPSREDEQIALATAVVLTAPS